MNHFQRLVPVPALHRAPTSSSTGSSSAGRWAGTNKSRPFTAQEKGRHMAVDLKKKPAEKHCTHPTITKINGKIHCARCRTQLYL